MQHLKFFLSKFKDYIPPELVVKRLVAEIVARQTGVKLASADIQLTNYTIYLKASPAAKSEIFIKHEAIMEELERELLGLRRMPKKLIWSLKIYYLFTLVTDRIIDDNSKFIFILEIRSFIRDEREFERRLFNRAEKSIIQINIHFS